jgi:Tripartite tricarboxylate transporter family receptor
MNKIGIDFTAAPYKGNGPAMNDMIGGQVDLMCDQTTNTTEQIRGGTVKVYGVTSRTHVPSLAEVPRRAADSRTLGHIRREEREFPGQDWAYRTIGDAIGCRALAFPGRRAQ